VKLAVAEAERRAVQMRAWSEETRLAREAAKEARAAVKAAAEEQEPALAKVESDMQASVVEASVQRQLEEAKAAAAKQKEAEANEKHIADLESQYTADIAMINGAIKQWRRRICRLRRRQTGRKRPRGPTSASPIWKRECS
jgi:hypothetical protein